MDDDETTFQIEAIDETFPESLKQSITQFIIVKSPYKCQSIFDQISRYSVNDHHEILLQCEDYLCFVNADGEYLYSLYQYGLYDSYPYFRYHNDHSVEMYYPALQVYIRIDAQGKCLEMEMVEESLNLEKHLNINSGYISKYNNSHASCTVDGFTYKLSNAYTRLDKIDEMTGNVDSVFQINNTQHVYATLVFFMILICIIVIAMVCGIIRIVKKHKIFFKNTDSS